MNVKLKTASDAVPLDNEEQSDQLRRIEKSGRSFQLRGFRASYSRAASHSQEAPDRRPSAAHDGGLLRMHVGYRASSHSLYLPPH